jgi:N-acetylglutamate synthase-like GNAT family acetyltransferase
LVIGEGSVLSTYTKQVVVVVNDVIANVKQVISEGNVLTSDGNNLTSDASMPAGHVNRLAGDATHLTNERSHLTSHVKLPANERNHLTREVNHLTSEAKHRTSHARPPTVRTRVIVYICNDMETRIEVYTDQYKQHVADLIVPIQQEEFNIPITAADQPDLQNIPTFYQSKNGNFWVAINDGRVVGTISLLDIGNRQGALRKMFVHKDFRGKEHGTGQLLLNTLFTWAKEKEYTEIYLGTTAKFLAAHRFYEKNNFVEVAVDELPASFPRMEVDVKFYRYGIS